MTGVSYKRLASALVAAAAMAAAARAAGGATPAAEPDLAAEARALADLHLRRFGDGYVARVDAARHVVYVSAVDADALGRVVRVLGDYADAQRGLLFPRPLQWNVTVILPTLSDYRRSGSPAGVSGYYRPATRTLTSVSLSEILLHEFTHALHHSDQAWAGQHHPPWIQEGLASLFQRSRVEDGRIELLPDASLVRVQEAVRQGQAPALAVLAAMGAEAFAGEAERHYAQARQAMLYLHESGRLKAFYEAYKQGFGADPTGTKALETALGKPLAAVEAEWKAWVLAQAPPWTPARPPMAHLGVRMEPTGEGVRVTGFLAGSSAQRAGVLRAGDIILSVAGQPTPTPGDLTDAVRSCNPGEVVDVEVVRDGRATVVKHVLGAVGP